MTLEHKIQNDIRVAISQNDCTIFRANVGKVRTDKGIWFDTGLPNGYPDLFGFKHDNTKIFFIEVKNENGRARPDQIQFHHFLESRGVIHGIARSADDAIKIVNEELIGYGYSGK